MAIHSSILAWEIPWAEEPGGLQSKGLQSWTQLRDTAECAHLSFLLHGFSASGFFFFFFFCKVQGKPECLSKTEGSKNP